MPGCRSIAAGDKAVAARVEARGAAVAADRVVVEPAAAAPAVVEAVGAVRAGVAAVGRTGGRMKILGVEPGLWNQ